MKILVVEDDIRVSGFLIRGLRAEGFNVRSAEDGARALKMALTEPFDLALIDIGLPGLSGLDVCKVLRAEKEDLPVIFLTARDSLEDKIIGLEFGADDYITKPFAFGELIARIRTVVRRNRPAESETHELRVGELIFNLESLSVSVLGKEIELTSKEMALLELFMRQPGKVFSREYILSKVWGDHRDPLTNIVEVYVAQLRKKLGSIAASPKIVTIRRRGYKLVV